MVGEKRLSERSNYRRRWMNWEARVIRSESNPKKCKTEQTE
jgi:hypothetical protein